MSEIEFAPCVEIMTLLSVFAVSSGLSSVSLIGREDRKYRLSDHQESAATNREAEKQTQTLFIQVDFLTT